MLDAASIALTSVAASFNPVALLAVAGIVLLNGWFVAAEYALVSVRRTRILELETAGSKRATSVRLALDDINAYISTAQVGVTMCSLAIGWLGEPAVAQLISPPLEAIGFSPAAVHLTAFIIAFLVITYFHVVVGELAPKSIALQRSEKIALSTIRMMNFLRRIMRPLIIVLDRSAVVLCRALGVERVGGMHVIHSEEELKMLVSQSSKGGVLEDSEQEMLYNVFDFADTNVIEVMVPRPDVVAFDVATPPAELLQRIVEQPFTRYPVYRGGMDDIIGILHMRDLFNAVEKRGKDKVVLQDLLRPAHLVPESKSLAGMLGDFRRSKSHMALVMDEYGSLTGIVTLEDLIEEIVGEIDDEHDRPEQPMERISENHVRVDGKYPIDELNEQLGLSLPTEDYHTIGGFVFGELGQQPHEGDVIRHNSVRFEVTETDGPRIVHVDIIMLSAAATSDTDAARGAAGSNGDDHTARADHEATNVGGSADAGGVDAPH